MPNEDKSLDILGVKPIADAALLLVKGGVDGASAILGRICLPAAEEFGLLLRDKVGAWRAANAADIAARTQLLLEQQGKANVHAHPRVVGTIIDQGSWEDDEIVKTMWAGLLASSCTDDGKDQSNIVFIDLLRRMTSTQAKLIQEICGRVTVRLTTGGAIVADHHISMTMAETIEAFSVTDIHQFDIELDALREIGLIIHDGGIQDRADLVVLTPSALALHLVARSSGYIGAIEDFYPSSDAQSDVTIDIRS